MPKADKNSASDVVSETSSVHQSSHQSLPEVPIGLVWAEMKEDQLKEYYELPSNDEKIEYLANFFDYAHYKDNSRSRAFVDFAFYNLHFCEENGFPLDKTSAIFSILKRVFDFATNSNSFLPEKNDAYNDPVKPSITKSDYPTLRESYTKLQTLLEEHTVDMPPTSIELFSLEDIQLIIQYITRTFYQHFRLYQNVFKLQRKTKKVIKTLVVETPLPPLPLAEGVEEKLEGSADMSGTNEEEDNEDEAETTTTPRDL